MRVKGGAGLGESGLVVQGKVIALQFVEPYVARHLAPSSRSSRTALHGRCTPVFAALSLSRSICGGSLKED